MIVTERSHMHVSLVLYFDLRGYSWPGLCLNIGGKYAVLSVTERTEMSHPNLNQMSQRA